MEPMETRVIAAVEDSVGVPAAALRRPGGRADTAWQIDGGFAAVRFGPNAVTWLRILTAEPGRVSDIAPDGSRALLVTDGELVEVTVDGAVTWRAEFPPMGPRPWSGEPKAFYESGGHVWLYRPDVAAGRDDRDAVMLLDGADGSVLATERIDTAGHGVSVRPRPDGSVLMDVGEGQDGVTVYRLRRTPDGIDVHDFGWVDRCLVDVSPGGATFLTVGHDQADAILHSGADGAPLLTITAEDLAPALGIDLDEDDEDGGLWFEWGGGYLDETTVTLLPVNIVEDDEAEIAVAFDTVEGTVLGTLPQFAMPLGDGTFVDREEDGRLVRRAVVLPGPARA